MATPRGRAGDEDQGGSVFPGFSEMSRSRRRLLDELVAHRRELGLSQTEVAARMGTSQSAVARLEARAADLRMSTLERYAAALDRSIEWRVAQSSPALTDAAPSVPLSPASSPARPPSPRAGRHDQGGQR